MPVLMNTEYLGAPGRATTTRLWKSDVTVPCRKVRLFPGPVDFNKASRDTTGGKL